MASVDLNGNDDEAAASSLKSPTSGSSDDLASGGAMDLGVVDELMQALSASKVELALEKEAATPLKQKLMRAQSEAELLQERLDAMQESANAERFEVLDVHT
jgi:PleD family two-component response regulator